MSYLTNLAREPAAQDVRIAISTQDPTMVPGEFVAASSLVVVHSFWPPSWFQFLATHTAPVDSQLCAEVVLSHPAICLD
jgi:hypothetical protein